MASVCSNSNIVSVSCGTKTVILQLSDGEVYSFLNSDFNAGTNANEERECSQTPSKIQNENEEVGLGLVCCDVSSSGKQLAFCTLSKNLCIVDISDSKPSLVRVYNLVRGASKVRFTPISNDIIVADKSGDVYQFVIEKEDCSGQLVLGHLSLLLDVVITPDEQFIITCDRDEKIRVSSYPNGYNIVSYCLGHSEFVSSLRLLPNNPNHLISTSGDGTIRFWDYKLGAELAICNISQYFNLEEGGGDDGSERYVPAITDAATTFVDSLTSLICVAIDNFSAVLVFKCTTENQRLNCKFMQNISLDNCHPWSLSLNSNILWIVVSVGDNVLVKTKSLNLELCKFEDTLPHNITKVVQVLNNQKLTAEQNKNVVNLLFKRKFENVQDYLRRKELRLLPKEPPNKKVKA